MHITNAFIAAAILTGMTTAAPYFWSARPIPGLPAPEKRDHGEAWDWRLAAHEALSVPANDPSQAYQNWANVAREAAPTKRAAATIKRDAAPSKREAEAAPTKRAAVSSEAKRDALAAPEDRDHKGRRNAAPTKREAEAAPSKRAAAPSKREADAAPTKRAAMPSKREAEAAPTKREADPAPTKRAALPLGPTASFDPDHTLYSDEEGIYRNEITAEPFIPPSKRDPEAAPSKRSADAAPTKRATPTAQWNAGLVPGLNDRDINDHVFELEQRSLPPIKRGRSGYNRVVEPIDDDDTILEERTVHGAPREGFYNGEEAFLKERDAVMEERTLPIWDKFEDYDYVDYAKRDVGHSRNVVEDTNDVVIGLKERAVPGRRPPGS